MRLPSRLSSAIRWAAALALTGAALAGCGGGSAASHRASTAARALSAGGRPAPSVPAEAPEQIRLQRSLSRDLRALGPGSGASVYDLTSHGSLFVARADVKRPPGSVEKLYTTVALLRRLGPGARLHTTVLATGHLGTGGVWQGNLYLHGGGDPTFGDGAFNRVWELGYGPTAAQLVQQLIAAGVQRVSGRVIPDPSLFDQLPGGPATAFAPDIPDFGGQLSALTYDHGAALGALSPAAFAARQLARTLRAAHVIARPATEAAVAPAGARTLARVSSPPLSVLLKLMDVPSDDLFAEMLTKQLGARFGGQGSIAGGARVIAGTIAGYRLHPRIVDGSGLSRADRSSPAEVVALLRKVSGTEIGRLLSASLPIVGVDGTVQRIATGSAAQGRCIAKTGTLNDVTNLAGYCHSRGRQQLAFALFADGPSNSRALVLESQMVAAIARY